MSAYFTLEENKGEKLTVSAEPKTNLEFLQTLSRKIGNFHKLKHTFSSLFFTIYFYALKSR